MRGCGAVCVSAHAPFRQIFEQHPFCRQPIETPRAAASSSPRSARGTKTYEEHGGGGGRAGTGAHLIQLPHRTFCRHLRYNESMSINFERTRQFISRHTHLQHNKHTNMYAHAHTYTHAYACTCSTTNILLAWSSARDTVTLVAESSRSKQQSWSTCDSRSCRQVKYLHDV